MYFDISFHCCPVFGCADLKVPQGGWYKREGDVASVGCEMQDLMWTLKCEGSQWTGVVGNCSENSKFQNDFEMKLRLMIYFKFIEYLQYVINMSLIVITQDIKCLLTKAFSHGCGLHQPDNNPDGAGRPWTSSEIQTVPSPAPPPSPPLHLVVLLAPFSIRISLMMLFQMRAGYIVHHLYLVKGLRSECR